MQKKETQKDEIKLVGISVRTSYQQEWKKMDGLIFPCVQKYFHQALWEKIHHRKQRGTTFCVYTEYDSDYKGAYTYFIGEEVSHFDHHLPENFQKLIIPAQKYAKFTTTPAPMPEVLISAWESIWSMSQKQLGGTRNYKADFEIYDERASDHQKIVLDVYIGVH